uniref:Cytidine and dCMP deaminase domain-containing protein 1 n=1 Tax=Poecilia latipinna TaxID=48699 RepID=A0A3B3VD61_9TELE
PITALIVKEATRIGAGPSCHDPKLSKVNLFTLLSLWMEVFPRDQPEDSERSQVSIRGTGLVVVHQGKVLGLHCSGVDLHAAQAAIIQHGAKLAGCQLYFSRRPCATCLKMIINAGVSQISFWPGDPEISMLSTSLSVMEDVVLDAVAVEKLKSNSRPHICVLLQPLAPGLLQFVEETSRESDFMKRMTEDDLGMNEQDLFNSLMKVILKICFLVGTSQQHKEILIQMGLENLCVEPYFSNLRNNMAALVEILAAVAAGLPQNQYGFYSENCATTPPHPGAVSQEVARHCIIQARLLAYRTEDPKVGVGAVIWARGRSAGCRGTGCLDLVGCGYNAYPAGSEYAEYPQMDCTQEDRQRRKYRYIIHAEQNALTFRTRDVKPEELTMMFLTKCPCDECIPLIRGAGITHIYTSDQDRDKDKGDISYLRFSTLEDIRKFVVNGCIRKHSRQTEQEYGNKKLCTENTKSLPSGS